MGAAWSAAVCVLGICPTQEACMDPVPPAASCTGLEPTSGSPMLARGVVRGPGPASPPELPRLPAELSTAWGLVTFSPVMSSTSVSEGG